MQRIEEQFFVYGERPEEQSEQAQRESILAAADPRGDPDVRWVQVGHWKYFPWNREWLHQTGLGLIRQTVDCRGTVVFYVVTSERKVGFGGWESARDHFETRRKAGAYGCACRKCWEKQVVATSTALASGGSCKDFPVDWTHCGR